MQASRRCSVPMFDSVFCMLSVPPVPTTRGTSIANQPPESLASYFQRHESADGLRRTTFNSGKSVMESTLRPHFDGTVSKSTPSRERCVCPSDTFTPSQWRRHGTQTLLRRDMTADRRWKLGE